MSGRHLNLFTLCFVLAMPAVTWAQPAPGPQAPRRPGRPIDFAVGGMVTGATGFGSASFDLLRSDGSRLTVFRTENRLAPGIGLEAHLGIGLSRRLFAEVSGGWSMADLETRITDDVEDAADVTLSESSSRFSVEGAVRWELWTRGRTAVFARGSAGWMRELAGNGALLEDGVIGSAGLGLRHWFRERRAGLRTRRIGVRVDGRLHLRTEGLTLGESKTRFAPVAFGGLVFGF